MSQILDSVMKIVDREIESQTLSLKAAEGIALLRTTYDEVVLENKARGQVIKELNAVIEKKNTDMAKAKDKITDLAEACVEYAEREAKLKVRELNCLRLEIENEYLKIGHADIKEIMMATVRNTEVRQRVHGYVPVAIDGSPGCSGMVQTASIDKKTDTETI